MKRLFQLVLVASLGLIFSLGVQVLPQVTAKQLISTQESALTLVQTGKKYYDAGNFSNAMQRLQQAAQIYKSKGNVLQQAQTLSLISLAYQQLGLWQEAEAAINASLSLIDTLQKGSTWRVRAQILNNQGRLQLAKGKTQEALVSFQESELLYTKAADKVGVIGSQINQAEALQTLGLYRRAYNILTEVERKLKTQPDSIKVAGLYNLGNTLQQRGDLERSQEILEQCLAVVRRLDAARQSLQESSQEESKILLSLGNTKQALASRAQELKNTEDAKQYTEEALSYYQKAGETPHSIIQVQAQLNLLSLFITTEQFTSAQTLLPKVSELLKELPASRASVYAHVNLAESLMKLSLISDQEQRTNDNGQITLDITQILDTAVRQARSLADKRAESYALGTLGKLYEKVEDTSTAIQFTQSALAIAETIIAPEIVYQWQWQMGRILQTQAEKKLHKQDAFPEAIAYYTHAFNILNKLRSDLVALNPEVQFSFRESVEPVYRQLVDLLLRSPVPSKDNLIKARDVIEALQLAELDNFFRDACAQPKPANIDNLDPNAAVIYPIVLENRLEVILKLPGSNNLRRYTNRGISETQVDEAVKKMQDDLRKRSTALSEIKQFSKQLYDWLIKPFENDLEIGINQEKNQIKTLVFVLDKFLQNVPVSVLYDGKKYLIERYAVAVTPGLQLLAPEPLLKEHLNALLAGATSAPSFERERLSPLENVKVELSGIGKEVNHVQKLEGKHFLQENLQNQINSLSFNVVHIATHAKFSSNPQQTFILDWNKRITVKDWDTFLRVKNQKIVSPVKLLVLSACETAIGDKRAALGLAGVAVRAGASSTLATLWQVNDASTARFMIQFYQQLQNPQITKAEALRNVQLAFLNEDSDKDYNRPYHWAPFILVGNWL
ncbi:hypothetical protein NUACC21_60970 [Scytonema sp. NUACC21]